jgi:hypothetical protein
MRKPMGWPCGLVVNVHEEDVLAVQARDDPAHLLDLGAVGPALRGMMASRIFASGKFFGNSRMSAPIPSAISGPLALPASFVPILHDGRARRGSTWASECGGGA